MNITGDIIEFKGFIAVVSAVMGYLCNCFTEMVVVLVFMMIIDYITGVAAAFVNGQLNSKKSLRGVFKKFGFMILVTTGFFLDFVINELVIKTGMKFTTSGFFGIATTCWLISTEFISIAENLGSIGVPVPKFLRKGFLKLQDAMDSIVEKEGDDNDK